jgi:hypothetical protein
MLKHCFQRASEPVVFYLHPWELDSEHPIVPIPSTVQVSHYLNLKRAESKFRRLLRDFQFTSIVRQASQLIQTPSCVA